MRFAACRLSGLTGHQAGRALLETLYREETGKELPPIHISPAGRPYFPGSDYRFSIAHTSRHALCVLGKHPVGLDAEELDRRVNLRLVQRVLSDTELAQFEKAPDKRRAILQFWVLKEAQVKCTGLGLRGFPNRTHFRLDDPRVWEWDGCLIGMIVKEKETNNAV